MVTSKKYPLQPSSEITDKTLTKIVKYPGIYDVLNAALKTQRLFRNILSWKL